MYKIGDFIVYKHDNGIDGEKLYVGKIIDILYCKDKILGYNLEQYFINWNKEKLESIEVRYYAQKENILPLKEGLELLIEKYRNMFLFTQKTMDIYRDFYNKEVTSILKPDKWVEKES